MNRIIMKSLFVFLITAGNSILLSECDNLLSSECSGNCEWVEDLEYGNCSNLSGSDCTQISDCSWTSYQQACSGTVYSDCVSQPGCSYSWLTYSCTGSTTVSNCSGGNYEIDNGYCQEIQFEECSGHQSESLCNNGDNCEWMESYSYGNCGNLTVSQCYNYPGECYVDSLPGWYDSSGPYCTGGTYQIDNSYCTDALVIECSDMIEAECSTDDSCNWVEEIEYGNCSNYNNGTACDANEECYWDLCYGGYYGSWSHCCRGGAWEIDNSYCEDFDFIQGDINQDLVINVLDVTVTINLILNQSPYNYLADINNDNSINIQDVIMIVQIILNG